VRLIVFGSRTWSEHGMIAYDFQELDALYVAEPRTLAHGACASGADYFADLIARQRGWRVERHPADWETHGKAAGPLRNEHMSALGADLAIGYRLAGESRGTDDMARACERHGIPLVRRGWGWA
jgi:YspA, cpYpsA-related SLOG family